MTESTTGDAPTVTATPSPELAAILSVMEAIDPDLAAHDKTVEVRRAEMDALLRGAIEPGTRSEPTVLGGRPAIRISLTGLETDHIVLYLHGGAYELGSPAAYEAQGSKMALLFGCEVWLLEYRLAPEHVFPAAVTDATAAYRDLLDRGRSKSSIAIVGDSAGGGLVAATLIAIHRESLPQPVAAVCLSPWADLTMSADAYERNAASDRHLDRTSLSASARCYLAGADPRDPLASPVCASADELSALAPMLIQAALGEVLADDATTLASNIQAAGGEATVELWPHVFHAWHLMGLGVPESRDALRRIAEFLAARWTVASVGSSVPPVG